jgi:hypothetical protein
MDALDSRRLTPQDGFAHRFARAGQFTYSAQIGGSQPCTPIGTISVSGAPAAHGKGKQFDVHLRWDEHARRFVSCQLGAALQLQSNDFVLFQFHSPLPGQPPCSIHIVTETGVESDSRLLATHDLFIHCFLHAGEYVYGLGRHRYALGVADYGSMSEQEHDAQIRRPLIVRVRDGHADVEHGHLVVGQSAIWLIEQGEGVSIQVALDTPRR